MTEHDLMGRFLGVYPRMLVTGIAIGEAQAMEIIRRTDRLFGSLTSNDYPYLVRVARKLRIPLWEQYDPHGDGDHQVDFLVRGGQVQVVDPAEVDVHAGHLAPTRGGPTSRYSSSRGEQSAEDNLAALHTVSQIFGPASVKRMIPWGWIEAWAMHAPKQDQP